MNVQLALYKGRGLIGNAIVRMWTGSIYSHCELVIAGFGMSSSLMDGGVRRKRIAFANGNWDLIALPWVNANHVLDHFDATEGQPYGWLDLVRSQIFNTARDQPRAAYCSEWCAGGMRVPSPTIYSPGALGRLAQFIGSRA